MSYRIWMAVIMLAALWLAAGCNTIKVPGNIAGQVLNEAGQGQGYLSVTLVDVETGAEAGKMTAEDGGNFFFSKVDPGTYQIKTYSMAGKELPNDSGDVVLNSGRTANVTVTLIPQED